MRVCEDCFRDVELRSEVKNESTSSGLCEVTGNIDKLIELEYFQDFFQAVLSLFQKDNNSKSTIVDVIQDNWNLFSENRCGRIILGKFIEKLEIDYSVDDKVSYVDSVQQRISIWNTLKDTLKTKYRFFIDSELYDTLGFIEPLLDLKKGCHLYRARINEKGEERFSLREMGCPPAEKSTAGRANPVGIPYLYLCQDIETTFHEVRAGYLDKVCVGDFVIKNDLKIVDFNYSILLYPAFSNGGAEGLQSEIVNYEIMKEIRSDLSKPLSRYDTEIEYGLTQWICEYCKLNGADGISFASSLKKDGINVVLFNRDSVSCVNVKNYTIDSIVIKSSLS